MMNRYVVSIALALLLAGGDAVSGQTRARIEIRGSRFGAAFDLGSLPIHVRSRGRTAMGWVAADWGPVRVWVGNDRAYRGRQVLNERDLRRLLGKPTVRQIERHAKWLGLGSKLRGQWFRADRYTVMLEVTARGMPVAELYDHGGDGHIDQILLTQPPSHGRYGERDSYRYRNRDGSYRYPDGRIRW